MRKKIYDKFLAHYAGEDVQFYDQEIEHQERLLMVMELKMKKLYMPDKTIFRKVRKKFKVSYPTVLQDITVIERMIANDKNPGGDPMKVWTRYFLTEIAKESIQIARAKGDGYTMAYAANIIGKHHLTDKEDVIKPDYDKIIPFKPELTFDPTVIGITLPENFEEIRQKYRKKFDGDFQRFVRKLEIPDAEIIEDDEE